jgi:hypothetical protein
MADTTYLRCRDLIRIKGRARRQTIRPILPLCQRAVFSERVKRSRRCDPFLCSGPDAIAELELRSSPASGVGSFASQ